MSYRVRFTTQTGATFYWERTFATRAGATHSAQSRADSKGCTFAVEELPEPGSTAAHHVEALRNRVKELEAVQKAMSHDLSFAIQIGDAMREAMRHGAWGHDGEGHLASVSAGSWDRFKTSLAASPQGTANASETPGEGGDSDRRRLEALERFIQGKYCESLIWQGNAFWAISEIVAIDAPTLAALADKLAEKEGKP